MQISVETTGRLGRRMTVALPADQLEREVSARLQRLSRTSRFPGFRPGKAPMKIIEAHYGGKVMEEVAGDLIQSSFYEAIVGQGLKPAGGPTIESRSIERGHDLKYTAVFEVYPEIGKLDVAGRQIERPISSVTEADIDHTLESLRKQRMTWRATERAAQTDDRLVIDFEGRINGAPFEGGSASDFALVLGRKTLVDGFEDNLIGAKAADVRSVHVRFPADYRSQMLAGQDVDFEVKVKEVDEPVLPAVDSEFAKQFGIQDGSVDSLRAEVRRNLERELQDQIRARIRDQVFEALLQDNELEVPSALHEAEIDKLIERAAASLEAQGVARAKVPADRSLYAGQARRRVALGLILAEIVKSRAIVADPALVRARVERLAESYESPQKFIEWHYAEPGRLGEIESLVLEEQVVDLLLQSATIKDKPLSLKELTQQADETRQEG